MWLEKPSMSPIIDMSGNMSSYIRDEDHIHHIWNEQIPATTEVTDSTPHHGFTQDAEAFLWGKKNGENADQLPFSQWEFGSQM